MRSRADRRRGALLAALMMAALPLGSLADEALPSPTAEAPAEPTAEPTDAPSTEPAPTPEASPAPTPEASPAPEASASPAPTASDAPAPTPEPSASPAPTVYPLLEPGMSGDGVLMLQNRLVELGYLSYAEGLAPDGLYDEATAAAVAGFQTRLQLEPTGIADDALQQRLYAPDAPAYSDPAASPQPSALPGFPSGGFPSGGFPSGGFPSGGFPSGNWGGIDMSGLAGMAGMQAMPGAEQQALPAVIPGQALTGSHSAGDRDMALYGALDAAALDGQSDLTALTGEDGEPLLSAPAPDGAAQTFSAALDGATLTLTAGEGTVWQLNGYALRMLERGGVDKLRLVTPEGECALATSGWLRGEQYGHLRAQGCVSQDFDVTIAPASGAITVRAAGNEYAAEAEDGALTLCNAEQEPDA